MKNNQEKIRWITRTAVMIALLVALQWGTSFTQAFAGQYITGSLVNCVLVTATLFGGVWSGAVVALLSPFCAFLLGIGPKLLQIVPAIALGNVVLVVFVHFFLGRAPRQLWQKALGVVLASCAKFVTLYCAVVLVLIPAMGPALAEKQVQTFTVMFSWPQLVTALIGSVLALLIQPVLKKAIKK